MKMNITGEVSNSGHWMECSIYQNYSASEVLVQGLAGVVNQVNVIKGLYGEAFFNFAFELIEVKQSNDMLFTAGCCHLIDKGNIR